MALTTNQERKILKLTDLLFKKLSGVATTETYTQTGDDKLYFEENLIGRSKIFPSQVWKDYDLIPIIAPVNGIIPGINLIQIEAPNPGVHDGIWEFTALPENKQVIRFYKDLVIDGVVGTEYSGGGSTKSCFYSTLMRDAIPFNFKIEDNSGSPTGYAYAVKNYATNPLDDYSFTFSENDLYMDTEAGVITFFQPNGTITGDELHNKLSGGTRNETKIRVSFYKYIGEFGIGGDAEINTINIDNSTNTQSTTILPNLTSYVFVTTPDGLTPTETIIQLPLNPSEDIWYWIKDTGNCSAINQITIYDPAYPGRILESFNLNEIVYDEPWQFIKLYYHSGYWYIMVEGPPIEYDGTYYHVIESQQVHVGTRKQWIIYNELINEGEFVNDGNLVIFDTSASVYDGTWWHVIFGQSIVIGERKHWIVYKQFLNQGTVYNNGSLIILDDAPEPYLEISYTSQTTVVCTHNFEKYARVTVLDSTGQEITAAITHNSNKLECTVTFDIVSTGKIILR